MFKWRFRDAVIRLPSTYSRISHYDGPRLQAGEDGHPTTLFETNTEACRLVHLSQLAPRCCSPWFTLLSGTQRIRGPQGRR